MNEEEIHGLEEFDHAYLQLSEGGILKALHKATDKDIKKYRVPN